MRRRRRFVALPVILGWPRRHRRVRRERSCAREHHATRRKHRRELSCRLRQFERRRERSNGASSGSNRKHRAAAVRPSPRRPRSRWTSTGRAPSYLLTEPKTCSRTGRSTRHQLPRHPRLAEGDARPAAFDYQIPGRAFRRISRHRATVPEWNLNLPSDGNADMDFVKALIDRLAGKNPIDPARVLGFGYNSGGGATSSRSTRAASAACSRWWPSSPAARPELRDGDQKRATSYVICPAGRSMFISHGMAVRRGAVRGGDFARICWAEQNGCKQQLPTSAVRALPARGCEARSVVRPVPDLATPWERSIGAAWAMFNGLTDRRPARVLSGRDGGRRDSARERDDDRAFSSPLHAAPVARADQGRSATRRPGLASARSRTWWSASRCSGARTRDDPLRSCARSSSASWICSPRRTHPRPRLRLRPLRGVLRADLKPESPDRGADPQRCQAHRAPARRVRYRRCACRGQRAPWRGARREASERAVRGARFCRPST